MSNQIKTIVILIVLVVLVIIGAIWYGKPKAVQETPQAYVPSSAGLTTSASDTSDAALQADLSSVGAQLNSLNTDTTNINQSLNQ